MGRDGGESQGLYAPTQRLHTLNALLRRGQNSSGNGEELFHVPVTRPTQRILSDHTPGRTRLAIDTQQNGRKTSDFNLLPGHALASTKEKLRRDFRRVCGNRAYRH